MKMHNSQRIKYDSDDYNRYSGPEYLDRLSLSQGHQYVKGLRGYQPTDSRIYEEICEALLNDPMVDASDIEVEVHSGIVTLRGLVESRRMKKEAELSIEHIPGVLDVFNLINLHEFSEAGGIGLVKNQARLEP